MLTQTITAPAVSAGKIFTAPRVQTPPALDQFSVIATCAGVIASELTSRKDEEIYGEGETCEYVYQVIRSDGRHPGVFERPSNRAA
jgi:CRP/FNR family nitrogen fixation transcriptional regulator